MSNRKNPVASILTGLVFTGVLATALGSFYTVDDGSVGVVSRFG